MFLEKLHIQGIRNIRQADLQLSPGANLFYGANGSGKTSLLEAIHLLSRGRSFRSRNLAMVINRDEPGCTCFGLINNEGDSGVSVPVGVTRQADGKFIFKVGGEVVTTASQLAETLPLQLINADAFELLVGSPGARRSFLDWGVFHVEHGYRELWARFQRCLKHRNSLLRHGKIDRLQLAVWDREFVALAQQIDVRRRRYLDRLTESVGVRLLRLGLEDHFEFRYQSGWDKEQPLEGLLEASLTRDQKAGYTHHGPHRGDLRILADRSAAADILSRGQIKTLVVALKLAQASLFEAITGKKCIFLLDDLPSELDTARRTAICRELAAMAVQVFITGVDREDLMELWPDSLPPSAMFHVEQGVVSRV